MFFCRKSGQTLFICCSLQLRDRLCKTCEHSFLSVWEEIGFRRGEKSPDIRQFSLTNTETIPIWQTRKERLLCLSLCFERLSPNISFAFKKEIKTRHIKWVGPNELFRQPSTRHVFLLLNSSLFTKWVDIYKVQENHLGPRWQTSWLSVDLEPQ